MYKYAFISYWKSNTKWQHSGGSKRDTTLPQVSGKTQRANLTAGYLGYFCHNWLLIDSVINSFQQTLKSQYIHAKGIQDLLLGQGLDFAIFPNVLFVQILIDGNLY